ncbi:fungal pheromone mating factor STE2 GPCR-domain-containing protein [Aspergillus pseudotamarii]|uniref:Fungal pheromone mating factor STE2 GPCR-domain-containing protein n=2 Tax=Aspergillus pseudotamarii TaxID=132259 RepID=A0A5N6SQB5_ASPPS|nr:fungal pheromone mating factor STE2 GPCR-domain-containing protein [Aspergillus pseudotamarii]KAE8135931.1 fungal pheromone mating factor STE2 GPCR-domain-containing protein [Aspergillus pseudotamarii]
MGSKFDPYSQNLTFHAADGTPFQVPVMTLDDFYQYCIQICINYGAQFGASVIIFIVLLLLTRSDKRASSVFFLNGGALLLNMGRLLCHMIYFTTDFVKAYQFFSGDYSGVPTSAYANSILGVILTSLLVVCIETSLVVQVQVVCANLRRRYRTALLCVSILVALIPVGFRLGYMVENCKTIVDTDNPLSLSWLESATNIVITISICFFCSIFVTKLGFAIRQRRRLGVRDFGPMKVVFVMGCQTLTIPAVLSILQYVVSVPELNSNILTLVTISLPLSSIWAGVSLTRSSSTEDFPSRGALWNRLTDSNGTRSNQASSTDTAVAMTYPSNKSSTVCYADQSAARKQHDPEHGQGISVAHDVSVHSCQKL